MRILVTGGSGYLGASLLRFIHASRPGVSLFGTYFSNPSSLDFSPLFQLDLRDRTSLEQIVRACDPQVIIHTAAQMHGSLQDLCRVNAEASGALARLAERSNTRLIHLSTDVIFDGRRGGYGEEDVPNPLTDYAKSKLDAEREVQSMGTETVIVRTSLIYGFSPLDPRSRAVLNGEMPRLFTDERRNPIWIDTLCAALLELCESDYTGVLHVAGGQSLSRYEFGIKLVRALGGDTTRLIPSRVQESGLVRPLDCSLDCTRAKRLLTTDLPGVDQVLDLGIY
jgi:dTDP-4-dehydrorhamnose reductase